MKIAILIPYIGNVGGGQRAIAKFSDYLQSRGHFVEFFTQKYNKNTPYKEFNKIKINILKPDYMFLSPFVFLFKKIRGFDFIITLSDFPANLSSIRNKPVFNICYSPKRDFYDLRKYYFKKQSFSGKIFLILKTILFKPLDFLAAQKNVLILPISKNVQKRVEKYYKRKDSKIAYCGVDFNKFKQGRYDNYILCVSRFVHTKRVDMAINTMKFVKNKKLNLYVIGDGPEKQKIKSLCEKYPNVKFIGKINEKKLMQFYSNCLAVVYTPIEEDLGLIPIEAGAAGKTTIASNEGGLKETIIHKKTGFLLDEVSPEKIAQKIDYLYKNKKTAKKMGREARKLAKKFDWKILLPKWEKMILNNLKN